MEKKELMAMTGLGIITILTLAAVVSAFTISGTQTVETQQNTAAAQNNGNEQVVQLSFKNGNYYPSTIYLKAGVPVKMIVDTQTVTGCMKTIVIPSLGVRKTVKAGDNTIEFTPTKEGTIPFSCSMGMGRGQFVVTADGTSNNAAPVPIPQNNAPSGSCGSGGGCGCGGAS